VVYLIPCPCLSFPRLPFLLGVIEVAIAYSCINVITSLGVTKSITSTLTLKRDATVCILGVGLPALTKSSRR
jgi:hypothetical protein